MENRKIFENSSLWENYDPDGHIREKTKFLISIIPSDVKSILDVGCGNGIITNELFTLYENVTGVDASEEALKYLKGPTIKSSCDHINVEDNTFDMVFSSELVEHLNDNTLQKTLKEFKRISKKYILLTFPNKEMLESKNVKCPKCGNVFHAYGHIQSLTTDTFKDIYQDFNVIISGTLGSNNAVGYKNLHLFKQKRLQQYFNAPLYTICPACNNEKFPAAKTSIATKAVNLINRFSPKQPYWAYILFEKQEV